MLYHWNGSGEFTQVEYSVFSRLAPRAQIQQLALFFGALALQAAAIVFKSESIVGDCPLSSTFILQIFLAGWFLSLPGNLLALQHFAHKFRP